MQIKLKLAVGNRQSIQKLAKIHGLIFETAVEEWEIGEEADKKR